MNRAVYNLLLLVFFPLIAVALLYRRAIGKETAAAWPERWGGVGVGFWALGVGKDNRTPPTSSTPVPRLDDKHPVPNTHSQPLHLSNSPASPTFWIHAVSVGEVMAATPVLRELRKRFPDAHLVLSTTTSGGRDVALTRTEPDTVIAFPLDFPWVVARALGTVRPDLIVLMEWEIWPNFLHEAKRRGAHVAVVNGRISDKGLRRNLSPLGRFFTRPALGNVDAFLMQSGEDARRANTVGAPMDRVFVTGNTKFDESATPVSDDERVSLRREFGVPDAVPVLLAGSTRDGKNGIPDEELLLAAAAKSLRATFPDLVLIVAPRHLERVETVLSHLPGAARRSLKQPVAAGGTLILDTFGELARAYALADVAFVGGSLAPWGGQSVFQPLAQGVATLFGPHMQNQRDISALAISEGVGFEVENADELAREAARLLSLPQTGRDELSQKARALIEKNQGVTARCVDSLVALLSEPIL